MEMPIDKVKNQRKGFCFITFDNEQIVQELLKTPKQTIGGKEVDVKKAQPPQNPRMMGSWGGMGMGRGGRGAPRGRGGRGGRGDWNWGSYGGSGTGYGGYGQGDYPTGRKRTSVVKFFPMLFNSSFISFTSFIIRLDLKTFRVGRI